MKYKFVALFVVALVAAVFIGVSTLLERTWYGPARIGSLAQMRFDQIFAKHHWDGYAAAYFYDSRVRIASPDIGDAEIKEFYSVLHEISWLRRIELYATSITEGAKWAFHY